MHQKTAMVVKGAALRALEVSGFGGTMLGGDCYPYFWNQSLPLQLPLLCAWDRCHTYVWSPNSSRWGSVESKDTYSPMGDVSHTAFWWVCKMVGGKFNLEVAQHGSLFWEHMYKGTRQGQRQEVETQGYSPVWEETLLKSPKIKTVEGRGRDSEDIWKSNLPSAWKTVENG